MGGLYSRIVSGFSHEGGIKSNDARYRNYKNLKCVNYGCKILPGEDADFTFFTFFPKCNTFCTSAVNIYLANAIHTYNVEEYYYLLTTQVQEKTVVNIQCTTDGQLLYTLSDVQHSVEDSELDFSQPIFVIVELFNAECHIYGNNMSYRERKLYFDTSISPGEGMTINLISSYHADTPKTNIYLTNTLLDSSVGQCFHLLSITPPREWCANKIKVWYLHTGQLVYTVNGVEHTVLDSGLNLQQPVIFIFENLDTRHYIETWEKVELFHVQNVEPCDGAPELVEIQSGKRTYKEGHDMVELLLNHSTQKVLTGSLRPSSTFFVKLCNEANCEGIHYINAYLTYTSPENINEGMVPLVPVLGITNSKTWTLIEIRRDYAGNMSWSGERPSTFEDVDLKLNTKEPVYVFFELHNITMDILEEQRSQVVTQGAGMSDPLPLLLRNAAAPPPPIPVHQNRPQIRLRRYEGRNREREARRPPLPPQDQKAAECSKDQNRDELPREQH